MRNGGDDAVLIEQSLNNIRFMIGLQLHGSTVDGIASNGACVDLRRMLDFDEALRKSRVTTTQACIPLSAA